MKNQKANRQTEPVLKAYESMEIDAEGSIRNQDMRSRAIQAARSSSEASEESFGPDWDEIMASAEEHKAQLGYYPWDYESIIPESERLRITEEGAQRFEMEQAYIRKFKKKHGLTPDEWENLQRMRHFPGYRQIVLQMAGIDSTKLLSIKDLARILKVGAKTIRNNLAQGTFPIKAHKIMGRTRFFAADVVQYLSDKRYECQAESFDLPAESTESSQQA
jgi:hypothetical protein